MSEIYLLRCPHCGKRPSLYREEADGPGGPIPTDYVVQCCSTMSGGDLDELVKRWDKRADPTLTLMPTTHTLP